MRKEDCFLLGHITRPHGYKGELVAVFDTDQPERYKELESVFVEDHGELVPFFISKLDQNSKGHFILQFEDIELYDSIQLVGKNLWLPLSLLPPLSGKKFYYHEVIGFSVSDQREGPLGTCEGIIDNTPQPLFQILSEGREILVPAIDEFIVEIDRSNQSLILKCPEGLVDLFENP